MYCLNLLAIALELARRRPGLRGRRQQVLGALPLHRARDEQPRRRRHRACGTRRTASSTTCCTCPTASRCPLKVRSMVGLIPLFAVETLEPEMLDRLPAFKRRLDWFIEQPAGPDRQRRVHAHARAAASAGCCPIVDRDRLRRVLQRACSTRTSSSRRTASARCRGATATQPYVLRVDGTRAPRRLRAGANRRPGCSAATRTGAGRSGFRSTTC